ncbi:hypothetical protein D3C73_1125700 [compost metagenome]
MRTLVPFADALGDGFELLGHAPHVDVVAARYDSCALHVAVDQDLRCQQDKPGFEFAADETLHAASAAG